MVEAFKAAVEGWLDRWLGWLLGGFVLFVVLVILAALASALTDHSEDDFIRECAQREPHYRCVERWRAGENHSTVTRVPIVIPVGK